MSRPIVESIDSPVASVIHSASLIWSNATASGVALGARNEPLAFAMRAISFAASFMGARISIGCDPAPRRPT